MEFTIVSSYEKKSNFGCDPYGYYVKKDKKILAKYGDDYHDKGRDKCEGFIDGYCFALNIDINNIEIKRVDLADYKRVYEN